MSIFDPILGRNPESVSISNSEIQSYKRCKRQWWLTYYAGLQSKEEVHTGPLTLGTRIHNALEAFYVDGTHPVDEYNRLNNIDQRKFMASPESEFPDNVNDFNKESELGRRMVEGYMEWLDETNSDADIKVVGAEQKLSYRLNEFDPRVEIIGKVDLEVLRTFDLSQATLDHKSAASSNFMDYFKYSHMSEQLMHYTLLKRLNTPPGGAKVDGGIYNVLKKVGRTGKAKPPFYMRIDVRFNDKTLASFWTRLLGTIRDIMNTRDALDRGDDPKFVAYPSPRMDWTCGKCPFFKACPMFDDGSYVEEYVEDNFNKVDPNARYDEKEDEPNE